MGAEKDFSPLLPPQAKRPKLALLSKATQFSLVRDQFTTTTWMCFGAVVQGVLILAIGRLALIPAAALILFRCLDAYAQATGWRRNTYMDGVVRSKFAAQFANEMGEYGNKPARDQIVVFLIGTRCNHPMGVLAPGFRQLGDYFVGMGKDLEEHADEFGFLGMTNWLSPTRASKNEIMSVCYFKTPEGLHEFAHSNYHREGWSWFNRIGKDHPHLSIFHETYCVPAGHWESIYANSTASGINSTTTRFVDQATGEERWASPMVDCSKGILKTSKGRMNRSKGDEHEAYEKSPFA